jgi:type I restriction enzyme S subunit
MTTSVDQPAKWFNLLPKNWKADRLGKFADIIVSNVDKKTEDDEEPVLLCNYVDVYRNDRITSALSFMEATATPHEIAKFTVQKDDVVTTKDSESPLDIAIPSVVAEDIEGLVCGYHLAILRADRRNLFGPYLAWLHVSKTIRSHYEMNATGITRWAVGRKHFKTCPVPLPPLPEQQRIAAYLDASCAAIDRAVETKRKQLETLDALRKSIITPAVLAGLSKTRPMQETGNVWLSRIPRGWKVVALKRVSGTQTGITLGKTYEPPLIERPYLRAANVQDGFLDLEKITMIEIPVNLAARYELQAGDVLMTEGGDLDKLGRGFPWDGQISGCLHQNHVFAIRTNPRLLLPKFLAYVTASRYGRDYFEATGKRTTNLASTNSTKVGLFPIPLPSVEEQRIIVDHIDEKLDQARQVDATITSQITTLTAYRKSLIHECVTGKRRISDADVAKVEAHG